MENLRSPFENIFNIIGGLPQGHEKPLKHALYNAVALLFLFLCCAAAWALYIILEPFIKPLIWALLVGSVLHPFKYSISTIFRSWFDKLDESHTPIIIGVIGLPINIINDLSEFIGSKLRYHFKIIIAVVISLSLLHLIYYYTPRLCVCIAYTFSSYMHTTVNWLIDISSTSTIIILLIGYISVLAIWWKPSTIKHFRYASLGVWVFLSCYVAHLAGSFQVTIFIILQLFSFGGFIYEILNIHDEMQDAGKHITYVESAFWVLENKTSGESVKDDKETINSNMEKDELKCTATEPNIKEEKEDLWNLELFDNKVKFEDNKKKENEQSVQVVSPQIVPKSRHHLKPQRSLSHPSPMSRFSRIPPSILDRSRRLSLKAQTIINSESLASDTYLYILLWACGALIFWKNLSLLPLLPLPIIIYTMKHVGNYFGLWQWIGSQVVLLGNKMYEWCAVRFDALVPAPIRGLYKISVKINSSLKDGIRDSIDTVSSILVILGLIVFMICASIFFAIQIYAEAIMLVQTTSNVINSTVVHNPELRQLLPPSLDETLDSILDNAYMYGREGISKLIRGMMSDVDSAKSAKLEQQVLELWDRVYQAWMSSNNNTPGPQVTTDAVQNSWEAFLDDIKKSPEMFNIQGITEFVKQNIGTFMSVMESLWSILKGNLTILVGSFSALLSILLGGGTAVLNFILNVIVFLTTLFYLLSSSGNLYKPVDLITNFSPYNGNRFGVALEGAVNGVFKASFKMAVFYGLWTWFIHNLFGVKIVYLSSALATVLGAVPFLGTYWACIPAVLDLWLAQSCGFKAILLAICQFAPSMIVDTTIYKEIKGGHPYLTGLAIAGGIFCLGFEGAIIGPLLLCGLYVVIDLSSSLFKESPSEEVAASLQMQQHLSRLNMMFE